MGGGHKWGPRLGIIIKERTFLYVKKHPEPKKVYSKKMDFTMSYKM
jgi:hypothetical protein